jgi:hypothetical protein
MRATRSAIAQRTQLIHAPESLMHFGARSECVADTSSVCYRCICRYLRRAQATMEKEAARHALLCVALPFAHVDVKMLDDRGALLMHLPKVSKWTQHTSWRQSELGLQALHFVPAWEGAGGVNV